MGGGVCKGAEGPCTQERGTRVRLYRMRRAPAVPDGRWSGFHARVGEGRAPTHTPPGVDEGGKTPPRPGVGNRCGAQAAECEGTFLIHTQAP